MASGDATGGAAYRNLYTVMVSVTLQEDWLNYEKHFSCLSAAD